MAVCLGAGFCWMFSSKFKINIFYKKYLELKRAHLLLQLLLYCLSCEHPFFAQHKTMTKKVRGFNNIFTWIFKILLKSKTLETNFL